DSEAQSKAGPPVTFAQGDFHSHANRLKTFLFGRIEFIQLRQSIIVHPQIRIAFSRPNISLESHRLRFSRILATVLRDHQTREVVQRNNSETSKDLFFTAVRREGRMAKRP